MVSIIDISSVRTAARLRFGSSVSAICLVLGLALITTALPAAEPNSTWNYASHVQTFLKQHCLECHSEKPEGDLNLAKGPPKFSQFAERQQWLRILERVEAGEMPPKTNKPPAPEEITQLAKWIRTEVKIAVETERAERGRVPLRRMNRVEYQTTVRDLLHIATDLKELLPIDSSADGFDNNADALHTSSFLLDRYLEAADIALNAAIMNRAQPPLVKKRFSIKDERHVKVTTENVFRKVEDTLIMFTSSAWHGITVGQFYPPDPGYYRIRISAYGVQNGDRPVSFRVDAGPMLMGKKNHLVGFFEVPANKPTVVEFADFFESKHSIRLLPHNLAAAQTVNKIGADVYEGPGLAVEWIEVEGPLYDTWPPASHRAVFGELAQKAVTNNRSWLEVVSDNPTPDAEKVLLSFVERAFRRPVSANDILPFMKLYQSRMEEGTTFEQALRAAIKGVLVSPEFLFLREKPGKLNDHALATRLSYFLWSSMPDQELLVAAAAGQLSQPAEMRKQVDRLLNSPKAQAFIDNYLGQWLSLRDIDFTEPDRRLYPEFDDQLKTAMLQEPKLFFAEMLRENLSVTNFVHSDFSFLNARLAEQYGIEGITEPEMRKVKLPPDSHRGGVMTMGAVLKVTANGTTTSPVVRGAWVLDRILGTPPRPPPANVAGIEPDIRGATTIREQLAKHREIDSCASCHRSIDPLGFALESYDVIGGWREHYRSVNGRQAVVVNGQKMRYYQGLKIDPSDKLVDGRSFANIDELKQLIVANPEQLAQAVTKRLIAYSTGRAPEAIDQPEVVQLVARGKESGYGLRTLIQEVVASKFFQFK